MTRKSLSVSGNRSLGVVAVGFALALLVGAPVAANAGFAATGQSVESVRADGSAEPVRVDGSAEPVRVDGSVGQVNRTTQSANETNELPRQRLRRLVHRFVNRERVQRGLDPLALNETLSRIARFHSRNMAQRDFFAHVSPGNRTLADRYDRFGFDCRVPLDGNRYATGAENIAYTYYEEPVTVGNRTVTYSTPKQLARGIVTQWMNSPPHRKNVLRPYWQREGIGFAVEETPAGTRVYVTQNFC